MSYKGTWLTWLSLLAITGGMLLAGGGSGKGGTPLILLLVAAMLVKAGLIAANFMHLRGERLALVLIVAFGILAVGAALFSGIAPDGVRTLRLRQ